MIFFPQKFITKWKNVLFSSGLLFQKTCLYFPSYSYPNKPQHIFSKSPTHWIIRRSSGDALLIARVSSVHRNSSDGVSDCSHAVQQLIIGSAPLIGSVLIARVHGKLLGVVDHWWDGWKIIKRMMKNEWKW